jgi:hypothetical protein
MRPHTYPTDQTDLQLEVLELPLAVPVDRFLARFLCFQTMAESSNKEQPESCALQTSEVGLSVPSESLWSGLVAVKSMRD